MKIQKKLWLALLRRLFWVLPIDKSKVVFTSYYGRGYSDSPKAIAEALLSSGQKRRLQWIVTNEKEAASLPAGIEPVLYDSAARVYAMATARVWVDNCRKYERFKKPDQLYLQTWHGFALKRIEADAADVLERSYVRACRKDGKQTDLIVSGSDFMTHIYQTAFWYHGQVASFGTPRNDVFFHPQPELSRSVRKAFGLPEGRKLALYAPTFRADHSLHAYALDGEAVLNACEKRFGGQWSLLVRLHPNVAEKSGQIFSYDGQRVLDATMYPDMQELLCAADLLITDYSSCMFDFALSGKPCIQFALDIGAYRADRGFYFPLDALPFPLADSNETLQKQIIRFDTQAYRARWQSFADAQGFREDGKAAQRCAEWILARTGEKSGTKENVQ